MKSTKKLHGFVAWVGPSELLVLCNSLRPLTKDEKKLFRYLGKA